MIHQLQLIQQMVRQWKSVGRIAQKAWGALTTKAIAALTVDADHDAIQVNDALVDTGGSKNLAS